LGTRAGRAADQRPIEASAEIGLLHAGSQTEKEEGQAPAGGDASSGAAGISTKGDEYDPTPIVNELRQFVDQWRALPQSQWGVTPETARLLQHWRHHPFTGIRPFFCQIEAVETAIWLAEVAPKQGQRGKKFLDWLTDSNEQANPDLYRIALKLATGAGKTTIMAMLIAWQVINAVRYLASSPALRTASFRGFQIFRFRWPSNLPPRKNA
jgi:type III restriction enzyme